MVPRALAALTLAATLLAASPAAAAERTDAEGVSSRMTLRVRPDGTIDVTEDVTFRFAGHTTGLERDLDWEADDGVLVDGIRVSEGETAYRDGGSRKPGTGVPGTYAVDGSNRDEGVELTWHFDATDEIRTFRFSYRMRRQTVAYADTAEIDLVLFSSFRMRTGIDRLDATVILPGAPARDRFRTWLYPVQGKPDPVAELRGSRVEVSVPAVDTDTRAGQSGQLVALHLLFPRSLLTSTAGARTSTEAAFDRIVREQEEGIQAARPGSPLRFLGPFILFGFGVNLVTWLVRRVRRRPRPSP